MSDSKRALIIATPEAMPIIKLIPLLLIIIWEFSIEWGGHYDSCTRSVDECSWSWLYNEFNKRAKGEGFSIDCDERYFIFYFREERFPTAPEIELIWQNAKDRSAKRDSTRRTITLKDIIPQALD